MSAVRIAVLTDAHANLPALRAALAEAERLGAEAVYHTGDLIGIGPYPAECMELLLGRPDTRLLMGNHDEWFAFGLPAPRPGWMSEGELRHQQWVHAQLDARLRPVVAAWPYEERARVGDAWVEFLHYPRDPRTGGFLAPRGLGDPAEADRLFGARDAAVVCFGHDHAAYDVQGRCRYLSPGALGCSKEAAARFALLEARRPGEVEVTLRAVPYDARGLLAEFDRRDVPERDFIRRVFMPAP